MLNPTLFQTHILTWFDQYGRKDLPWQKPITPYQVWVSEVMLQQTQVSTVIPYFNRFMQRFPDIESLANAPLDDVLQHWAGLGYYARGRNLHKAAGLIVAQGKFPQTLEGLTALPGIGLSTAGAILSIAFQQSAPILDGNVRRVLARFGGIEGWTGEAKINQQLWDISRFYTPQQRVADYTQAMMDLGATLCTRSKPLCLACPVAQFCVAKRDGKTALLPTPKPSKKTPVKTIVFLLLEDNQQILLEKRPPLGIWGGLWSLPEFADLAAARAWCLENRFVCHTEKIFPTQRHTFSHYHLDYTPLLIHSKNPENHVMESDFKLWYKLRAIHTLALPAPIARLLQDLHNERGIENDTNG
jgi:A/G-specific adenine glycosylase